MTKRNDKSGSRPTKSKTCHTRHIKVNTAYYLTPLKGSDHTAGRRIPWIQQLKAYWLQEAGFEIDARIKVRVMEGYLVLTTE